RCALILRNKIFLFILTLSAMLFITACGSTSDETEKENNNEQNNDIKTKERDDRIVSTTVAITEFLEELDLNAVGVLTTYKELPKRFDDATEVGNAMSPDFEIVLSLEPTDVLSVTNLQEDLEESFNEYDIPAHFLDLDTVDGMLTEIENLGEKYNRTEEASEIVNSFDKKMDEVEETVKDKESPKVIILMGVPGSYIVGTENSYIGDLVKRAGGENAVTDEEQDFISANTEYLQQLDTDIMLSAVDGAQDDVREMFDQEFDENDIWKNFKAVKNDSVYDLEETLFGTTANLAVQEATDELLEILYSEY